MMLYAHYFWPFLSCIWGGRIKRTPKSFFSSCPLKGYAVIIIFLWIIGLSEISCVRNNNIIVQNIYLTCIPLSLIIFYGIVKLPIKIKYSFVKSLPMSTTLDIYIWHRLVYLLLVIFHCYIGQIGAIEVFVITAFLSIIIRKNEK